MSYVNNEIIKGLGNGTFNALNLMCNKKDDPGAAGCPVIMLEGT